ncbi:MAG: trypsin-like peptidase domain-containing protein [bacterium]|nr:trypsin-like peptidase domain-containing protein [bacterium]
MRIKTWILVLAVFFICLTTCSSEEYDKEIIKNAMNKVVIIKAKGDSEYLYVHKIAGFKRVKFTDWEGSGVIISSDGIIVTNNHVVEGAKTLDVINSQNKKFKAKILTADPLADIALIKIDAENLEFMTFGDINMLQEGDDCWAIGNTLGHGLNISKGMITSMNQNILHSLMVERFFRFNAKINHGNSGGALINSKGELVGIPTIMKLQDYHEQTLYDFNLAIPVYQVKDMFDRYKAFNYFYRSWLGLAIMINTQENKDFLGIKSQGTEGYLVEWVFHDSPGEKAGLKKNDIILEINGVKFEKLTAIQDYIFNLIDGTSVNIKYSRNGEVKETKANVKKLFCPPEEFPPDFCMLHFLGLEIDDSLKVISKRKGSPVEQMEIPETKIRSIIPAQTFDQGYEQKVKNMQDLAIELKKSHIGKHQFALVVSWGRSDKENILFIVDDKLPFIL